MKTRTAPMAPPRLAYNRIDYIVFGNAKGARQVLWDFGYEPPNELPKLAGAVKQLIRKKGKKAIEGLLSKHPDRTILLELARPHGENSYCGACGSKTSMATELGYCGCGGHRHYDGGGISTKLQGILDMDTDDLEGHYRLLLEKAGKPGSGKQLADEVQMVWNELRLRTNRGGQAPMDRSEVKGEQLLRKDVLVGLSIGLGCTLLGVLVMGICKTAKDT